MPLDRALARAIDAMNITIAYGKPYQRLQLATDSLFAALAQVYGDKSRPATPSARAPTALAEEPACTGLQPHDRQNSKIPAMPRTFS